MVKPVKGIEVPSKPILLSASEADITLKVETGGNR